MPNNDSEPVKPNDQINSKQELIKLKRQRGQIRSQLTRTQTFIDNLDKIQVDFTTIIEIKKRLQEIQLLRDKFEAIQSEIEFLTILERGEVEFSDSDVDDVAWLDFETKYYSIISNLTILSANESNFRKGMRGNKNVRNDETEIDLNPRDVQVNSDNNTEINFNNGDNLQANSNDNNAQINSNNHNASVISNNSNVQCNSNNQLNDVHQQIRLPPISLPKFSGQYGDWLEFKDGFNALINGNSSLSNIQRFYYLRSYLQKDALQIIDSIPITSDNFITAWEMLHERFEKNSLIVNSHVRALFEFPRVLKECHSELRNLLDTFTKNIRALKTLGQPTDTWDTLIVHLITTKLDSTTRREWELYDKKQEIPLISEMNIFLRQRCDLLEKMEINSQKYINKTSKGNSYTHSYAGLSNLNNLPQNESVKCYFCEGVHTIYHCGSFKKLSVDERIKQINKLGLCYNCLKPNHAYRDCKSANCKRCKQKHNSLLHIERQNNTQLPRKATTETDTANENDISNNMQVSMHVTEGFEFQVLLSTAIVFIKDRLGKLHECRALLDCGSQSNFLSEQFCRKLNIPLRKVSYSIAGLGQRTTNVKTIANVSITSRNKSYNTSISCLVLEKITNNLPAATFNKSVIKVPTNIQLADPKFNLSSPIDLLIGASLFWELMCVGQLQVNNTNVILQKTKLGWVIAGSLNFPIEHANLVNCHSVSHIPLDIQLDKFWKVEEINTESILSDSETICEKHFVDNFKRDKGGNFILKIPFKENAKDLGQSRELTLKRFHALEIRLNKNHKLRNDYIDFMREYHQLGHMSKIQEINGGNNNDNNQEENVTYYLPHHPVIRESSVTTKLRVVFDASMKADNGLSLNDVQYVGPTIQNDLLSIILRFRKYNVVMTADISKMYRNVLIDKSQRSAQRIFWRENSTEKIECYELNTVTYGTASASFLAIRCLFQLAAERELEYPTASKAIKNDFFVDDFLSGADCETELLHLQREVAMILEGGGFQLRKWLSNIQNWNQTFYINKGLSSSILILGENEPNKTLGVQWNAVNDSIQYSVNIDESNIVTKRTILSTISQIFDPLGLLSPVIITAKILIQKLWQAKVNWDTSIPQYLFTMWANFRRELPMLNTLRVPRQVTIPNHIRIELHAFGDASEKAYAACIYIRCNDKFANVSTKLLCAKSRVAPIKQLTLPRLELCSALLVAQLTKKVVDSMDINFDKVFYWSDSTITLCWLRSAPNKWKTFVANRVAEIQRITKIQNWHHVSSKDNPADLATRGLAVKELKASSQWWSGPEFLKGNNLEFDNAQLDWDNTPNTELLPEQRVIFHAQVVDSFNIFNKFSSLNELKRVFAYILRFIFNSKTRLPLRKTGNLSLEELNDSLDNLVRLCQMEAFSTDYEKLSKQLPIDNKSSLLCLNPFLDKKRLIRVGGRMQNANSEYDKRYPIILPSKHELTKLIMRDMHEQLLHCGPTMLLACIRQQFWPISGRTLSRQIVRQCVKCFRVKPCDPKPYLMGNLPEYRINECIPFCNTGCDFAGPFLLRDRNTRTSRGGKLIKGYLCLFICLATKAVHLEAVSDLSTQGFVAALKRFIGRRGKPSNIYSDNGSNFVGASSELKTLYKFLEINSGSIDQYLAQESIKWHFIPARAPSFGGVWEAGIKSAKYYLKRIMGESHLNFEEFNTVLIQVEAMLNSRPLCPLSSTPDQLNPLTPAHFLLGKPVTALPEKNLLEINENRLKRFERLQRIIQHFWSRWHLEYISELQGRSKWKIDSPNKIQIGTIVLVKEDNAPPFKWHLGRVKQVHPGRDNVVRVASVLMGNNTIVKRPLSKLCILPIEDNRQGRTDSQDI